jgi:hypothetical protein
VKSKKNRKNKKSVNTRSSPLLSLQRNREELRKETAKDTIGSRNTDSGGGSGAGGSSNSWFSQCARRCQWRPNPCLLSLLFVQGRQIGAHIVISVSLLLQKFYLVSGVIDVRSPPPGAPNPSLAGLGKYSALASGVPPTLQTPTSSSLSYSRYARHLT